MKLGTRKELFSAYGDGCYRRALDEIGFDGVYSLECGWKDFLPGAADDARADCLTALMKHLTAL